MKKNEITERNSRTLYICTNLFTKRVLQFRSAQKFRGRVTEVISLAAAPTS